MDHNDVYRSSSQSLRYWSIVCDMNAGWQYNSTNFTHFVVSWSDLYYRDESRAGECCQSRDIRPLPCACATSRRMPIYKPTSSTLRLINDDGSEVLVAVASAAGTDSTRRQPGWLVTLQQDNPHRISRIIPTRRRSHQRRYWTSSEWWPSVWV